MEKKTFEEISELYDFEIDRAVKEIKKRKARTVLLQFPEGLKPYSTVIADEIEKRVGCNCLIWLGECFGACDIPDLDADLIIQFGHTPWKFKEIEVI